MPSNSSPNPKRPTRRSLIVGTGLGLFHSAALAHCGLRRNARRLVCVQLTGGNDGLSTVVPVDHPVYRNQRRKTRHDQGLLICEGGSQRSGPRRGLHPSLSKVHQEWLAGRLAIIEGVATPTPVRSHFKALDMWHAGCMETMGRPGWLTNLAKALYGADLPAHSIVHVGDVAPGSCVGHGYRPVVIDSPGSHRFTLPPIVSAPHSSGDSALAMARRQASAAKTTSVKLAATMAAYEPSTPYPMSLLGRRLASIGAVLKEHPEVRLLSTSYEGFDTHSNQRPTHDALMEGLDGALGALLEDTRYGTDPDFLVLVFSEFGRRVSENASKGTDHGLAGPVFVLGPGIRGGLYGQHPSLDDLDQGDLRGTTDFRCIPAEIWRRLAPAVEVPADLARMPSLEF